MINFNFFYFHFLTLYFEEITFIVRSENKQNTKQLNCLLRVGAFLRSNFGTFSFARIALELVT